MRDILLALLLLNAVLSVCPQDGGLEDVGVHTIEVLMPENDKVVQAGQHQIVWRIRGSSGQELAVAVHIDGMRDHIVHMDGCVDRDAAACTSATTIALMAEGEHLVSLLLLLPSRGAHTSLDYDPGDEAQWDIVGDTSVALVVVGSDSIDDKSGQEMTSSPFHLTAASPQAADARGRGEAGADAIIFESPRLGKVSFMDPNQVDIAFRIQHTSAVTEDVAADVLVSGRVVAKGVTESSFQARMPQMQPGEYSLQVILRDLRRGGVVTEAEMAFYVWPDHSWVKNVSAEGKGLEEAEAGQLASFHIISSARPGEVVLPGADSFVVRLTGPAVISATVKAVQGVREGAYQVEYLAAEEGSYTMSVQMHYDAWGGLQDYGDENARGVIGWDIGGSPFQLTVVPRKGGRPPDVNPYVAKPLCTAIGEAMDGRWVAREHCDMHGLDCWGMGEDDDGYVWLPWECTYRGYGEEDVKTCWEQGGGFRVLIAGTSQQRTLFFDVGKLLGTRQVQPRKYWADLESTDTSPNLFFHWMIPSYDPEGFLDYDSLIEGLDVFVQKHRRGVRDVLVVQASVHDIHLGSLGEYTGHVERLAAYLSGLPMRVLFRSGDALHMPPAGRSIIERGLRDPRIRTVNRDAKRAMGTVGVTYVDTHMSTVGRPDKCIDGYHYFDRETEVLDKLGLEICIGNSVARTQAQILLNFICTEKGDYTTNH